MLPYATTNSHILDWIQEPHLWSVICCKIDTKLQSVHRTDKARLRADNLEIHTSLALLWTTLSFIGHMQIMQ